MPAPRPDGATLSERIFAVSAAMVGVCLTGIGLVQVLMAPLRLETIADDLLVADALLFLMACVLAYASLRGRTEARTRLLERFADLSFLLGLGLMFAVCCGLVYAL